jgi:hypothetical protein
MAMGEQGRVYHDLTRSMHQGRSHTNFIFHLQLLQAAWDPHTHPYVDRHRVLRLFIAQISVSVIDIVLCVVGSYG